MCVCVLLNAIANIDSSWKRELPKLDDDEFLEVRKL